MKRNLLYLFLIFIASRCAQITPLTGGKKDSTAPKVVLASPPNASLNFKGNQIKILFDEYINLRDITNQLIITPQTRELPDVQAAGKTLKITFSESLMPNTTYKLSFGNAIVDLHEGNVFSNFEYVFSTGNVIDSLELKGTVVSAVNKKPLNNVLVGLYSENSLDSAVFKEKPLYIARTNDGGSFQFSYLPNNKFKLIAIDDVNKNLLYDGSDEQIAFNPDLIKVSDSTQCELLLFKETPKKQFVKKTISNEYGKTLVIYNKPCNDLTTITWNNNHGTYYVNDLQDSLTIYYENIYDTLRAIVHRNSRNDSLTIKIPSRLEVEKLKKNKRLSYIVSTNLSTIFPYYETPSLQLNIPFSSIELVKNKINLYKLKDSIKTKQNFEIEENPNQINSFLIKTKLESETFYQFSINKAAFTDSIGRTNDSLNIKFKTTSPDDYAQLKLKLFFPKKENYIVLLLNDKEQIVKKENISFSLASTSEKNITFDNLLPGNYFIKIVEDANKNNAFDTGDFISRLIPETIFINLLPIKLLAGWEIENEWKVK